MKIKEKKSNKTRINKSTIAVRVICGFLAAVMIMSACATCVYYVISMIGE